MFERFKSRSLELERLDTGDYTPAEYARWQLEMNYIHRFFGEERALKRTLLREIEASPTRQVSVLDVGAGSGALLNKVQRWCVNRNTFFVGAERDAVAARSIERNHLASVQCNALRLPFADRCFDYVYCSLFLHHLNDGDSVRLLREMGRVARKRIFILDLNRNAIAFHAYRTFGRLVLQRFTLEDGALSILRSRTPEELVTVASKAGLSNIKVERSFVNRLVLSGELS